MSADQWKSGDEFAAFHPQASHVDPDYRDGWNACHAQATARIEELQAELQKLKDALKDPTQVHAAMLRGDIAAIDMQTALHIAGNGAMEQYDALQRLAAFGSWVAREFRDSLADVDGGSAQDAMERFGVIERKTVTEPCGEGCVCVEYGAFPHECFTFPEAVSAAIAASLNPKEPK